MSTVAFGPSPSTSTDDTSPWWRRILVPLGVGVAVMAPLTVWLRRRRHRNHE